jgi:hypothetical protein
MARIYSFRRLWQADACEFDCEEVIVALHEAAHAVVAHVLGHRIVFCRVGARSECIFKPSMAGRKLALVCGAGPAAEYVARKLLFWNGSADGQREMAERVGRHGSVDLLIMEDEGYSSPRIDLRPEVMAASFRVVLEHWSEIAAVAEWLLRKGRADACDVERILSGFNKRSPS